MTTWDPDGPGPLGQHLVCGGEFQFAGAVATANIALLDPSTRTWSALGAGFDGPVFALAVLPGGTLSAAGAFQQSGTAAVAHVATWNGSAWTNLGTGTDGDVFAAAVMANGDLAIGGAFTVAGGSPANNVARWNGTSWSALGSGVTGTPSYPVPPPTLRPVTHLGVRSNGELVVAGDFTTAGGIAADGLARWNGTTWSSLGFGPAGTRLTTMRVLQNDDVLVGTDNSFGSYTTQRWNGSTWTTLGLASQTAWNAFCEQPNGTLLAQRTGYLSPLSELLVWNGTAWVAANGPTRFGPAAVFFATGNSELWLAGPLRIEGVPTVTRFDGLVWRAPAAGFDGYVFGVTAFRGDFVLAGSFGQVDHVDVAGIAIRQNGVWAPLGPGVDGVITSVLPASDGTLVVGGWFTVPTLPGTQVTARWDGQQWSSMGNLPGALS
jgi:hypothetical protein